MNTRKKEGRKQWQREEEIYKRQDGERRGGM